jgi:hypothetical protein
MWHFAFLRVLSVVLSFQNIHANKNKGFQWPTVISPQSLNQPDYAVKPGIMQFRGDH